MSSAPHHCRPAAYAHFAAQLPRLDTVDGLVHAAIAVSMQELTDVEPRQVDEQLQQIAQRVRTRVRSRQQRALLAHLHDVLFEQLGFHGATKDYYSPANSYLPKVLETKQGLPVLLCLVYKCVAERSGLTAYGVNTPGHFLAAVQVDGQLMLVDPFDRGRVLSRKEMEQRILQVTGETLGAQEKLPIASHRRWIARIITNLIGAFGRQGPAEHAYALRELLALLGEE